MRAANVVVMVVLLGLATACPHNEAPIEPSPIEINVADIQRMQTSLASQIVGSSHGIPRDAYLRPMAWVDFGQGWHGPYWSNNNLCIPVYQDNFRVVFDLRYPDYPPGLPGPVMLTSSAGEVVGRMEQELGFTFAVELDTVPDDDLFYIDGDPVFVYVNPDIWLSEWQAGPQLDGAVFLTDAETGEALKRFPDYWQIQRDRNQRVDFVSVGRHRFDVEVHVDQHGPLLNHWASIVGLDVRAVMESDRSALVATRVDPERSTHFSAVVEVDIPAQVRGICRIELTPDLSLWLNIL